MRALAVVFALLSAAHAQGWSITANAPVVGAATAQVTINLQAVFTGTAALPIGPVGTGTFFSYDGVYQQNDGHTRATLTPSVAGQTAPLAFTASASAIANVTSAPGQYVATSCSMDTEVIATLHAPQPVSGRIHLSFLGFVYDNGDATIDIDLGDDGSFELQAQAWVFGGTWSPLRLSEFPVQIGTTGFPIRIRYHSHTVSIASLSGGWSVDSASMTVEAQFFPGQAAVQYFDATGASASLIGIHALNDHVVLILENGTTPGILVFGTQPLQLSVVGLPSVTQLVSIDTFVVANFLDLPMPSLPPGTALYSQGLVVGSVLRSSNSIRALWP